MSGFRAALGFALLSGSFCLAAANAAAPAQHKHKAIPKHTAKVELQPITPPPPPGPLTPFTLEQTPAIAPQVAYRDGALTIVAQNATLGDILRAVHAQTGAVIDATGSTSDRVIGNFGPGPSREVLAKLLNGSRFNYVMVGSTSDVGSLQKLVITPKPSTASSTVAQIQPNGATNPYLRTGRQNSANGADAQNDEQADDYTNDDVQNTPEQPEATGNQPPIKTPDQLLQELQRQQIQQQQQAGPEGAPQDTPSQPPGPRMR